MFFSEFEKEGTTVQFLATSEAHFDNIIEAFWDIYFRKQKYLTIGGGGTSLSPPWTVLGVIGVQRCQNAHFCAPGKNPVSTSYRIESDLRINCIGNMFSSVIKKYTCMISYDMRKQSNMSKSFAFGL